MRVAGRAPWLVAFAVISSVFANAPARAQSSYTSGPVERPSFQRMKPATLAKRALSVRQSRNQRIKPAAQQRAVGRLAALDVSSAQFQKEIALQPPQVRAQVFVQKSLEAGITVDQPGAQAGQARDQGQRRRGHRGGQLLPGHYRLQDRGGRRRSQGGG